MALVGWELPLFSSDLEPQELKRLRCDVCSTVYANVQCHQCNQQFCVGCEAHAHSTVSNPATHQDDSEPCNVCQDCQVKGPDFFCRDCERYQCELCCSMAHNTADDMRTHNWIATEGAPIALVHHSTWATTFKDFTKIVRRQQQHGMHQSGNVVKQVAGSVPDYLPFSPARDADDDDATSEEGEVPSGTNPDFTVKSTEIPPTVAAKMERQAPDAGTPVDQTVAEEGVEVKMERVQLYERGNVQDTVSATEETTPSTFVAIKTEPLLQTRPMAKPRGARNDVVDLTEDDEDDFDSGGGGDRGGDHAPLSSSQIKPEPFTTTSLLAPTSASSVEFPSSFADEDLLRSATIREYNALSQQVTETEHQRAVLSQRAASGSVHDMLACKRQLDQLKNTLIKVAHSRNATVARLLVYLYGDDPVFVHKVKSDAVINIPDAQAAYHRRLRELQTMIDQQRGHLHVVKSQMDEAVTMKSGDAYAEVVRLGREISNCEQQLQTLEAQRLDAFAQLAHVSAAVRSAVLALVGHRE